MRLTHFEIESIKLSFQKTFQKGKIYLFGSRTDDNQKGGDIDLYIQTEQNNDLTQKKIQFLVELKSQIGEQKIDVILDRNLNRSIDKIAQKGILIWKN